MSLKPQPPRPMPPEIGAWGVAHLPAASPYRLIGDTLYDQYHDEDFADLYHPEGKPARSPVLLVLVTVFQHLENLSDRRAARRVRTRLDWKYALHLPLDDAGFDSSVLCEFRQRLLVHGAEARVFEQVLGHLNMGADHAPWQPAHRQPVPVQPRPHARPTRTGLRNHARCATRAAAQHS